MRIFHDPHLLATLMHVEGAPKIIKALTSKGAAVRFVGGCVRDALLKKPIADIDIATPLLPEAAMALLRQHGLKVVPIGLKHGTIAVYLNGKKFEITTLRRDIECNGRHAIVAFTDDWQQDAARRDFTINALSCSPEGIIHDYFGGLDDLYQGVVRFVGDPYARIEEDFLRILRFFRFSAYYARAALEPVSLAACRHHAASLARLSGERIQAEMLKILLAPNVVPILSAMQEQQVLPVILPCRVEFAPLAALVQSEPCPNAIRRLALLLRNNDASDPHHLLAQLAMQWKLSNKQREQLQAVCFPAVALHAELTLAEQKKALRILKPELFMELARVLWAEAAAAGHDTEAFAAMVALAENWPVPLFPLNGRDLQALGIAAGKQMGVVLKQLETYWEEHDYIPDRERLLEYAKTHIPC